MQEATAAPRPSGSEHPGQALELSWLAPIGLISLSVVNFLLRIVTLGVYDFWARTEVRKRLWSAIRLNGEPLAYTGTGKELFLGFLIVFGVVLLPILLVSVGAVLAFGPNSAIANGIQALIYGAVLVLFGVGVYRAQRYRLSRTTWRGIRGNLEGNSWTYGWTYLWTLICIPLTLGWIVPWRTTKLQSIITGDARFGNQPFAFRGNSGPLYGPFAVLWFSVILLGIGALTIIGASVSAFYQTVYLEGLQRDTEAGRQWAQLIALEVLVVAAVAYVLYLIVSAWYRARTINHFASCTHFDEASFRGRATGLGLLSIDITNLLILILGAVIALIPIGLIVAVVFGIATQMAGVTEAQLADPTLAARLAGILAPVLLIAIAFSFTLLLPITQSRSMGYLINHVSLHGTVDVAAIAQSEAERTATGEGLAQAFDVDAF